ncbi:hypothetical protein DV515_00009487 [Chloebia gouldiae]|uniref:Ig-like domain-containing protein n=1 Tax=Chloebia gouldiae TaxID=44316 RepID=A0A3L8SC53_CHLGU|nr:hypothetical protein DV515_00009487 [Chloebia gouldiae]
MCQPSSTERDQPFSKGCGNLCWQLLGATTAKMLLERELCSRSLADPHLLFSLLSPFIFPDPGSALSALLDVSLVRQTIKIICSRDGSSCDQYQPKFPGCAPVIRIYYNDLGPPDIPLQHLRVSCSSLPARLEETFVICSGDQPKVAPTVHLFAPSSEELSQGKATVVCLIENFYPRDVTVEWVADGKTITSGVETSQSQQQSNAQQQSNTRYIASSYLSLTPTEWQSYNSVSCKVRHTAGNVEKTLNRSECA